jgi:hypothetical protein
VRRALRHGAKSCSCSDTWDMGAKASLPASIDLAMVAVQHRVKEPVADAVWLLLLDKSAKGHVSEDDASRDYSCLRRCGMADLHLPNQELYGDGDALRCSSSSSSSPCLVINPGARWAFIGALRSRT